MADLAKDGLRNLQQRMLRATCAAQSHEELVQVQRDLVEGARRLELAVHEYLEEIGTFRQDAEEALARYETEPSPRQPALPRGSLFRPSPHRLPHG